MQKWLVCQRGLVCVDGAGAVVRSVSLFGGDRGPSPAALSRLPCTFDLQVRSRPVPNDLTSDRR